MSSEQQAKEERIHGRRVAQEFMQQIGEKADSLSENGQIGFWLEMAYFVKINMPEGVELGP